MIPAIQSALIQRRVNSFYLFYFLSYWGFKYLTAIIIRIEGDVLIKIVYQFNL
jgi:hypothetical protein